MLKKSTSARGVKEEKGDFVNGRGANKQKGVPVKNGKGQAKSWLMERKMKECLKPEGVLRSRRGQKP